ncbi:MAG: undecaprenyl-phosphate glucose phosphotransferase [Sandaracinaceae bacterium]|nr:undecaprenyl-phosphate glucose phosphotransferase [Sandaracinaceae bacterium]
MLLLRLSDVALVVLALILASLTKPIVWTEGHFVAAGVAAAVFWIAAGVNGLYGTWRGVPIRKQVLRVWTTWLSVGAVLLLVAYATKTSSNFSRTVFLTWLVLAPLLLTVARVTLGLTLQEFRQRGWNSRSVAFAGLSPVAERLARTIIETPWSGMRISGFYDDRYAAYTAKKRKLSVRTAAREARMHAVPAEVGAILGDFEQLVSDAKEGKLDIVYISLPLRADERIKALIASLSDTTASVHVVADVFMTGLLQARWTSVGEVPVLAVHETPFMGVDGMLKRAEDIVLGSLILLLISVPMLVIAGLVKLTSKGPVFFRQRRYGLNGEEILVWKFRSMTVSEDGPNVKQATKGDARITPLGAILRRTSLDELPQFINVLTGEMSIVGPRPHAVAHNEFYRSKIHGYMLRHKVKPGITGWAQVNGWRGETDTLDKMEKRIEYDLTYIRQWGLWFDVKIIFRTAFGMLSSKNAY